MVGSFVVGGLVVLSLALGGTAQGQSSCDAGVTKALAKKVSCKLKVFAAAQKSGVAVNTAKLTKCEGKFAASCVKAQSKGDCQAQTSTCDALEAMADAAVDDLNGAPPTTTTASTSTTTTTLDPFRPCGRDPGGRAGESATAWSTNASRMARQAPASASRLHARPSVASARAEGAAQAEAPAPSPAIRRCPVPASRERNARC